MFFPMVCSPFDYPNREHHRRLHTQKLRCIGIMKCVWVTKYVIHIIIIIIMSRDSKNSHYCCNSLRIAILVMRILRDQRDVVTLHLVPSNTTKSTLKSVEKMKRAKKDASSFGSEERVSIHLSMY